MSAIRAAPAPGKERGTFESEAPPELVAHERARYAPEHALGRKPARVGNRMAALLVSPHLLCNGTGCTAVPRKHCAADNYNRADRRNGAHDGRR